MGLHPCGPDPPGPACRSARHNECRPLHPTTLTVAPLPGCIRLRRKLGPAVGRSLPPVLILHGTADKSVPMEIAVEFVAALRVCVCVFVLAGVLFVSAGPLLPTLTALRDCRGVLAGAQGAIAWRLLPSFWHALPATLPASASGLASGAGSSGQIWGGSGHPCAPATRPAAARAGGGGKRAA